jgi:hypothetical protein
MRLVAKFYLGKNKGNADLLQKVKRLILAGHEDPLGFGL